MIYMPVKKGDKVKVHYTGTLDDGTVFDSSEKHGQPLEFEVGAGMVIKGFDDALIGMEPGKEKEIHIDVKEAYGDPNPQLVQQVPKEKIPAEAKEGSTLIMGLPNGQQMPAKVIKIKADTATLDLNHPLAGNALNFKLKLVEIVK